MTGPAAESVPRALLVALQERRGDCPELELLLEPERAGDTDRERIARHVELCPVCAAIVEAGTDAEAGGVDEVSWRRVEAELDRRERPWGDAAGGAHRRGRAGALLAIAAVAVALVGGLAVWQRVSSRATPTASGVLRGAPIQALEPAGAVDSVDVFRWRIAAPLEDEVRVEVEHEEAPLWTPLWSGVASGGSLEAPASLREQLAPGAYRWRVTALDSVGAVVARSTWVEFRIE